MRGACLEFVTVLREAAARHGAGRDFVRGGFGACDALRARLRDEGTDLTDRQTEDAYLARVRGLAAAGDYMLTTYCPLPTTHYTLHTTHYTLLTTHYTLHTTH